MEVKIEGLEDMLASMVDTAMAQALDARTDDPWLNSDEAAAYLGVARST